MTSKSWPNFIILGAAKAGTTTLYKYLLNHPGVCMSNVKEPRYFAFQKELLDSHDPIMSDSVIDEASYLDLFSQASEGQILGEASPIYLASETASSEIASRLPNVRLVVILRDPAERAFSHFLMSQRQGYEPENDFVKALGEPVVQFGDWQRVRPYIPYSTYGAQLKKYFDLFDSSQILVLFTHDLEKDQNATFSKLVDFLGVGMVDAATQQRANSGYAVKNIYAARLMRSKTVRTIAKLFPKSLRKKAKITIKNANSTHRKMTQKERAAILSYLSEDIALTEDLLGCSLKAWRSVEPQIGSRSDDS